MALKNSKVQMTTRSVAMLMFARCVCISDTIGVWLLVVVLLCWLILAATQRLPTSAPCGCASCRPLSFGWNAACRQLFGPIFIAFSSASLDALARACYLMPSSVLLIRSGVHDSRHVFVQSVSTLLLVSDLRGCRAHLHTTRRRFSCSMTDTISQRYMPCEAGRLGRSASC